MKQKELSRWVSVMKVCDIFKTRCTTVIFGLSTPYVIALFS